jgi:hypothetical protein
MGARSTCVSLAPSVTEKDEFQCNQYQPRAALCCICYLSYISDHRKGNPIQSSFVHVTFISEFLFTGLLLKTCTPNQLLKYSIHYQHTGFPGIYTSFSVMGGQATGIEIVMKTGVILLFLVSFLVLASKVNKIDESLIMSPDFWFTAGIFFHFGLYSLLLLTSKSTSDLKYHDQDQFSIMYVIIFLPSIHIFFRRNSTPQIAGYQQREKQRALFQALKSSADKA